MEVLIIGLGLIGGSLAKQLKKNSDYRVIGYDINEVLTSPFTVVTPDSKNPYKQMYVAN
mgnify:CR=1 FL=1